ncbi:hypothetical protein NQ315_009470, partial [Exocentrus adspersus]
NNISHTSAGECILFVAYTEFKVMRIKRTKFRKSSNNNSKIIWETFKDFAENTSIHGLKHTVTKDVSRHEKVFWVLVIISGICGAVYMTVLFWQRYTSNLSRTSLSTISAPTTAVPFPGVTICNLNPIMLSKMAAFIQKLDINDTADELIVRRALPQLISFTDVAFQYNLTELTILQSVLEQNNYYDTTLVMEEISSSCSDMLLHCIWNGRNIPCLESFSKSFSQDGVCCSFNFLEGQQHPTRFTKYGGMEAGLKVLLNPHKQDVFYSHLYPSGFKSIIHYPTEYPGPSSDSRLIPAGKIFYLQVLGTNLICSEDVKMLPIDQRKCLYPDEHDLTYFGTKYTDFTCFLECEENIYFTVCDCVPFYYSFSGGFSALDKPTCNISKLPCIQDLKLSQTLYNMLEHCNCMSQCEDSFYQLISTSAVIVTHATAFSKMAFENFTDISGYNVLNVFFLSNEQTIYMRNTVTSAIYLLSSFGGVYGLFMGCSLITVAEIFYCGLFRFLVNLKGIGTIGNNDMKNRTKLKKQGRRINVDQRPHGMDYVYHIYGQKTFVH